MASSLIVDFNGPIAFFFGNNQVQAFIPSCDGHTCNVITDSNDVSPDENNTFTLSGQSGVVQTQLPMGALILQVDPTILTEPLPTQGDCYCVFQLPIPNNILGLRPEFTGITTDRGEDLTNYYARGVRFYYNNYQGIPTITPYNPSDFKTLDATTIQPPEGSDVSYQIEIRYHDTNMFENDHDDAKLCSATLRGLFPPLDQWTLTFDDPNRKKARRPFVGNTATQTGPHGVDCGANGFVINGGGIVVTKKS